MVLETIYVTRHGFRATFIVDPLTGTYTSTVPSPTNIPGDVPLVSYGHDQARQLAEHIATLDPPVDVIYSSPYARCLQTLEPVVQGLRRDGRCDGEVVRGENGIGEWFGATTTFNHPRPASPAALHSLFPFYSTFYTPIISSTSSSGETIDELYDRVAYTLQHIIADLDADPSGPKSVLLCTHAATLIAIGRVLTGRIPMDVEEQDFKPFTCGLTVFKRRNKQSAMSTAMQDIEDVEPDTNSMTAVIEWRNGKGIAGGVWECVRNGDCSFLNGGQERGWYFSSDETFPQPSKTGNRHPPNPSSPNSPSSRSDIVTTVTITNLYPGSAAVVGKDDKDSKEKDVSQSSCAGTGAKTITTATIKPLSLSSSSTKNSKL